MTYAGLTEKNTSNLCTFDINTWIQLVEENSFKNHRLNLLFRSFHRELRGGYVSFHRELAHCKVSFHRELRL